eukprot:2333728-Rhodomonas_salina.2
MGCLPSMWSWAVRSAARVQRRRGRDDMGRVLCGAGYGHMAYGPMRCREWHSVWSYAVRGTEAGYGGRRPRLRKQQQQPQPSRCSTAIGCALLTYAMLLPGGKGGQGGSQA